MKILVICTYNVQNYFEIISLYVLQLYFIMKYMSSILLYIIFYIHYIFCKYKCSLTFVIASMKILVIMIIFGHFHD